LCTLVYEQVAVLSSHRTGEKWSHVLSRLVWSGSGPKDSKTSMKGSGKTVERQWSKGSVLQRGSQSCAKGTANEMVIISW
jgi:hypothetical protein